MAKKPSDKGGQIVSAIADNIVEYSCELLSIRLPDKTERRMVRWRDR